MSKKPANKKLSALEKKLLSYAKKGQSVLLYSKDASRGRVNLIKRIHLLNGGIDASWEYPGYEGNIKSSVVIHDSMTEALKEQDTEKAKSFLDYCEVTRKTWRRVDCEFKSGEEVFNILCNKFELFSDGFNGRGILQTKYHRKIRELYKQRMDSLPQWKKFLFCHGLLFVDNLKCTRNDPKDEEWYLKLAQAIESIKEGDRISGDWLVAYAYNYTPFPEYFKEQFKLIPLDSETEGKKIKGFEVFRDTQQPKRWSISSKDELFVYYDYDYEKTKYSIKLTNLQFSVFCCLYEKIGSYVKIRTLEKCWKDSKPCYSYFVSDCISKIRNKIKETLDRNKVQGYGDIIKGDKPRKPTAYKLIN